MGIAYLGIGVGGALVPLLAHALTEALGWRTALQVLGVLMIAIALPARLLRARAAAPDARPRPGPGAAGADSILDVLRQPAFYLLALGSMASIGAVGGTMQNLKLYLAMDRGHRPGRRSPSVLSLVLVGSIAGRLLMGWLADRWPQEARDAAHLPDRRARRSRCSWAAPAPDHPARGGRCVFGVGLGGDYMIIPLMAAELFGLRRMGRVMGIVLTADGVAEAVVPMAVAAAARPHRQLRARLRPARGPGRARGGGGRRSCRAAGRRGRADRFTSRPRVGQNRAVARQHSTLGQQAPPRGQQEGKAGGQGGAPRPARAKRRSSAARRRGRGPRHRRHRPRPAAACPGTTTGTSRTRSRPGAGPRPSRGPALGSARGAASVVPGNSGTAPSDLRQCEPASQCASQRSR